jgi:hypothetical protein
MLSVNRSPDMTKKAMTQVLPREWEQILRRNAVPKSDLPTPVTLVACETITPVAAKSYSQKLWIE